MAAYLVGSRGTAVHAVGLGLSVAVSHTLGIVALAILIIGAQGVLPPDLVVRATPVIAAVSIAAIGGWMLLGEVRRRRGGRGLRARHIEHAPAARARARRTRTITPIPTSTRPTGRPCRRARARAWRPPPQPPAAGGSTLSWRRPLRPRSRRRPDPVDLGPAHPARLDRGRPAGVRTRARRRVRPRDGRGDDGRRAVDGPRPRPPRPDAEPLRPRPPGDGGAAHCLGRRAVPRRRPDLVRPSPVAPSSDRPPDQTPAVRNRDNAPPTAAGSFDTLRLPMRDLSDRALDTAVQLGASYADVRVVHRQDESIASRPAASKASPPARARASASASSSTVAGASPARSVLTAAEADRVAGEAVRIASASATALRDRVRLDDRPPAHGTYETPVEEDPFAVPLEEKIGHLLAADEAARRVDGVAFVEARYDAAARDEDLRRDRRQLDRADVHPRRRGRRGERDRGRRAPATELSRRRRRPVPRRPATSTSAGSTSPTAPGPLAEEAVALLSAPQCPSGRFTVVLDPSQLYMQIHESCGHPTELDRVFGTEASYAGHELPDDRQARRGLPLRQRPRHDRRRRDGAGRHGDVRLGRRGRRGAGRAARPGRDLRRLPLVARDRAADRAASPAARCGPTAGTGSR